MARRSNRRVAVGFLAMFGIAVWSSPLLAQDLVVYDDALATGFQNWSWATHDLTNSNPVANGAFSISWEADAWEGLYFHADSALDLADWSAVEIAVHGGAAGGQQSQLNVVLGGTTLGTIPLDPAPGGSWGVQLLDLRAAGMAFGTFDGLIFQDATGADQATLYYDDLVLIEDDSLPPPPTPVVVAIDPSADRRPIDPRIYGVNFGDAARVAAVGYPLRRWGGNAVTRYNWRVAVHNTASDYFFQNIVDSVPDPSTLPHGSTSDLFVDETLAAGADVLMTAPAIGYTPLDERVKRWSFSQALYGPQLLDECSFYGSSPPPWCTADAGDGTCDPAVNTTGYCSADGRIVGNDPADTSQTIGPQFIEDWVDHLEARVGSASQGGVHYWAVDNEPMLWNSTHRDLFPTPLTYDGLWSRTLDTALAIKAGDPSAEVLGPVVWGWCAFFSSAADAAFPNGSCTDGPDRQAHGGQALIPWYLEQICTAETTLGFRPVDILDVHFYPQGGVAGLEGSSGEDPTTAARRLRSVAELWDPSYVSESWIGQPVELIPRLRGWIDTHCPGVGLAITEYKWGADDGASSALAHAEVLALFGREGVDLATRWVAPAADSAVEDAYRLYLDYDGAGASVEGTSIQAVNDDPDRLGSYAIEATDGTLWLVLVNRDTNPLESTVSVASGGGFTPAPASLYRFDASTPLAFAGAAAPVGEDLVLNLPARSATLVVTSVEAAGEIFRDGFESGDTGAW